MGEPMTENRLEQYIYLKMEVEHQFERIARMKSAEKFAPRRESDGSQHTAGDPDRLGKAIDRRMEYEEAVKHQLDAAIDEMRKIEAAISSLRDGQERELLRLRFIDGQEDEDGNGITRLMTWPNVALKMFGSDEEKHIQTAYRVRRRALKNIGKGEW